MAETIEIKVPDIGGAQQVDVIELLVKVGDVITKDTPLITLESDKASMEIPSPKAGHVVGLQVKVGDKVSEGDLILTLSVESEKPVAKTELPDMEKKPVLEENQAIPTPNSTSEIREVVVPDIGGAKDVDVIEVMVKSGDVVKKDQGLITLEGDKATMEIPSPYDGVIQSIQTAVADKVSQGSLILKLLSTSAAPAITAEKPVLEAPVVEVQTQKAPPEQKTVPVVQTQPTSNQNVGASPAVRRLAREFGVNLSDVSGTGRKSRILKEDIQAFVKKALSEKNTNSGFNIPSAAKIDFSQFGGIETKPLNKIKKLTGIQVHRSWVTIPHVTQFDEADITDLEAFRKSESSNNKDTSYKLTILAFVCKVISKALTVFPQFNASLDSTGEHLILKQYCNIGIAVETPNGLVVPVIKGVDALSIADIAKEMARLSTKAREKGLTPIDMSGGCFTISSLGGIGGTAFTPIVNSPEVAILGLSRASIKPIYDEGEFKPRLMLPLSLSYDHRVIDGAEAARFTRYIADCLSDIRKILI